MYEGRLREDRAAAELQRTKVRAQSNDDDDKLRRGGRLQDEAELYRRQVDEMGLELEKTLRNWAKQHLANDDVTFVIVRGA